MAEVIVKTDSVKSIRFGTCVKVINWRYKKRPTGKVHEWWGLFQCACGKVFEANVYRVKTGATKSCGCLRRKINAMRTYKHGNAKDSGRTREYITWESMKQRCFDRNCRSFESYGGRGVTVCERWKNDFQAFLNDMGPKPAGTSLDRIDVNGDYTPANCRWATSKEQSRNKQNTKLVTAFGFTKPLSQWSEECGVSYRTLQKRLSDGWASEKAISKPVRGKAKK